MSLHIQFVTFGMMFAGGAMLGSIFDVYRVVSLRMSFPRWLTAVFDVCYWILAAVLLFRLLYEANGGQLRFFVFLAILLGGLIYFRWFSRITLRIVDLCIKVLQSIGRGISWTAHHFVFRPLVLIYKLVLILLRFVVKCLYPFYAFAMWLMKITRISVAYMYIHRKVSTFWRWLWRSE